MRGVNAGFFYGQWEKDLEESEADHQQKTGCPLSPHEKGEFRRAYWTGRVHADFNNLAGSCQYLTTPQIKAYHERLVEVYFKVLIDIYGSEEGARDYLKHIAEVG